MPGSPAEIPGCDPPIIEPVDRLVRVHLAGHTLAETRSALILRQEGQDGRIYIPRPDVDMTMLLPSGHLINGASGPRAFFDLPDAGDRSENAAWSYEGLSALSGRRNTVDAQRGRLTTRNSLLMPCAFQ